MANNEDVGSSIGATPEAEDIAKAIRRGISVADILDRERGDWYQRHRGVLVKKKAKLGHTHVHKIYARYFEKMSQYLFFIPVLGRVLVAEKNHKDVMAVETAVIKAAEGAIAIFDERIGQFKAAIEAHDIGTGDFNKTFEIEVSHASPLDKLYFQVLEKADMCLMLNYNLWVENALNPDYRKNELHRTENEWEVKRLIKNVNYQIIVNYRRLLNTINREQRDSRTSSEGPTKAAASATADVVNLETAKPATAAKKGKARASEEPVAQVATA